MVQFVNCFEVPVGRDDEFVELWRRVNAYMTGKPGYVRHRLNRALRPDARYRFVNLAEWESVGHWQQAHDDGFRALVSGPEWADFPSTPALYEVVHENSAAG